MLHDWGQRLRSAIPLCTDERLKQKIEQYLQVEPKEIKIMRQLYEQLQSRTDQTPPDEKLLRLLESIKPLCSDEEFNNCELCAMQILKKFGYKPARQFVIDMNNQFRLRAREMESKQEITDGSVT